MKWANPLDNDRLSWFSKLNNVDAIILINTVEFMFSFSTIPERYMPPHIYLCSATPTIVNLSIDE